MQVQPEVAASVPSACGSWTSPSGGRDGGRTGAMALHSDDCVRADDEEEDEQQRVEELHTMLSLRVPQEGSASLAPRDPPSRLHFVPPDRRDAPLKVVKSDIDSEKVAVPKAAPSPAGSSHRVSLHSERPQTDSSRSGTERPPTDSSRSGMSGSDLPNNGPVKSGQSADLSTQSAAKQRSLTSSLSGFVSRISGAVIIGQSNRPRGANRLIRKFRFRTRGQLRELHLAHDRDVWYLKLDGEPAGKRKHKWGIFTDEYHNMSVPIPVQGIGPPHLQARMEMTWKARKSTWIYDLYIGDIQVFPYWVIKGSHDLSKVEPPEVITSSHILEAARTGVTEDREAAHVVSNIERRRRAEGRARDRAAGGHSPYTLQM